MGDSSERDGVVIDVAEVSKDYRPRHRRRSRDGQGRPALDGVSLQLRQGETLAVVGESGSGKSTLARIVMGLLSPTSGTVRYRGTSLDQMSRHQRRQYRRTVQMVFQDPETSLSPRLRSAEIIAEAWIANPEARPRTSGRERVVELLELVGLSARHADRYAHELSGGQRQRLGIARALAVDPQILVCDEPVSSLDVSVQAQVINLFQELKRDLDVSYLFIAHDLGVVRHLSDRTMVLCQGRAMETGSTQQVFEAPASAYTQRLLEAAPRTPAPAPRWQRVRRAAMDSGAPRLSVTQPASEVES